MARPTRPRPTRSHHRPLRFEPLEDRRLLAITVDTLVDEADGSIADGDISLRDAIALAPSGETIDFSVTGTISLTLGVLRINDAVIINGPAADHLTIDASGNDPTPDSTLDDGDATNDGDGSPVFVIYDEDLSSNFEVMISGLTLTGGDSRGGGAISSSEFLHLSAVVVTGNSTIYGGGGINASGALWVVDSVISHNASRGLGGGIFIIDGSIEVSRSVVSFNSTRNDLASGGGICVENSHVSNDGGTSVVIENSVISNNSTIGTLANGGGLFVNESPGEIISVQVSGSTISENTASGGVAGIYLNQVTATIADSTISSNRWVPRSGTLVESYVRGGIFLDAGDLAVVRSTVTKNSGRVSGNGIHSSSSGEVHLDHSIVAGNINLGALAIPVDIAAGGVITARSSLIGAANGIATAGGNIVGTPQSPIDPLLGPLVYNGGPVFADGSRILTHALLPGSPALNAGDPAAMAGMGGVPEFDQRGMPWSRVAGGRIDIGAFEAQPNPLAGDYDFNGVVDAADYVVWRNTFGSTNDLRADGSGNGVVDQADYDLWRANFGNTMGAGGGAVAEDPHPLDYSRPLPEGEVAVRALAEPVAHKAQGQPSAEPGAVGVAPVSMLTGDSARQPPALPGVFGAAQPSLSAMGVTVTTSTRKNHALRPGLKDVPPNGGLSVVPPAARHDALLTTWLDSRTDARRHHELDFAPPVADHNETNDPDQIELSAIDHVFDLLGAL